MIREKSGGRFEVFVQAGGKKKYVGTYRSKREASEAEEEARVTQRKVDRGELAPQVDTKRTFGAAVKLWLAQLEKDESPSHEEYKRRVDNHVLPTFEHVPIVDIRKADVIAWRDKLVMAPATKNTVIGTLSSAFSWFVDNDWLEINPCRGVKLMKTETKVFPWLQSTEAITRLLCECTPNVRSIVAFLVGTGCRLDETLRLTWDDIDLDHRLVRMRHTKSGKVRYVPIFNSVLPVLKAMKLARGCSKLLWPGANPGRPLTQPSVRGPFKRAVEHAELPTKMRIHDLRHSFASLFLADGGDIFKLSRILGHSSVVITERTYAHLKPTAYDEDYDRVSFAMPSEATVLQFASAL